MNLLAAREYTARGIRRKLVHKEYTPEEADSVVERLVASGIVDDSRYAAEYARQKLVLGGASVRRVRQALAQRGIDPAIAVAAIERVLADEPVDQDAAIERLALRKLRSLGDLEAAVKRRRVFGFLVRRGYELDDIKRVLGRVSL
ncbi:MAG: regulatory protein RecX [Gemmatimonadaceae bacterium]